jgi:hypothetical protein
VFVLLKEGGYASFQRQPLFVIKLIDSHNAKSNFGNVIAPAAKREVQFILANACILALINEKGKKVIKKNDTVGGGIDQMESLLVLDDHPNVAPIRMRKRLNEDAIDSVQLIYNNKEIK